MIIAAEQERLERGIENQKKGPRYRKNKKNSISFTVTPQWSGKDKVGYQSNADNNDKNNRYSASDSSSTAISNNSTSPSSSTIRSSRNLTKSISATFNKGKQTFLDVFESIKEKATEKKLPPSYSDSNFTGENDEQSTLEPPDEIFSDQEEEFLEEEEPTHSTDCKTSQNSQISNLQKMVLIKNGQISSQNEILQQIYPNYTLVNSHDPTISHFDSFSTAKFEDTLTGPTENESTKTSSGHQKLQDHFKDQLIKNCHSSSGSKIRSRTQTDLDTIISRTVQFIDVTDQSSLRTDDDVSILEAATKL